MPRPKSPDGRRVPVTTRFSEPEAAEIDAARGTTDRSAWVRSASLAIARGQQPAPQSQPAKPSEPVYVNTETPQPAKPRRAKPTPDCPHPKARILKGLCGACGTYVGNR